MDDLLQQLDRDRSWLLQQIDGGRWPELRLDLAALERELGQLITRAPVQAVSYTHLTLPTKA